MTSRNLACFIATFIGLCLPGCISFIPDHVDPASLATAEDHPDLADDERSIVLQLLPANEPPNPDGSACAGLELQPCRYRGGRLVDGWHFLHSRGSIGGPVPEEMFDALEQASADPRPWPVGLDLPPGFTMIDGDAARPCSSSWHGLWSCSRVVFAPSAGVALVETGWYGGLLASCTYLHVFVRDGDGWSPLASRLLSES